MQQIGTHYSQLGLLLLNDSTGSITSAIVTQFHSKADEINQEILSRWLQGQGKHPVNWFTLIRVLRDMQLLELAKMIQKCLIEAQVQENNEWQQQLETLKQQLHTKEESISQLQEAIRQKVAALYVYRKVEAFIYCDRYCNTIIIVVP